MADIKIKPGTKTQTDEMEEYNKQAYEDYNTKALDKCENCGRTFLPERLVIHLRSCLKGTGSKKVGGGSSVNR